MGIDPSIDLPFVRLTELKLDLKSTHLNFPPFRSRGGSLGTEFVLQPGFDGGFGNGVFDQRGCRHDFLAVCPNGGYGKVGKVELVEMRLYGAVLYSWLLG